MDKIEEAKAGAYSLCSQVPSLEFPASALPSGSCQRSSRERTRLSARFASGRFPLRIAVAMASTAFPAFGGITTVAARAPSRTAL